MPHNEDTNHIPGPYWINSTLDSDNGPQTVLKFEHPKRKASFPDLYLLPEPHPLRPQWFTPANHPRCDRQSFNDYVVTIRKTSHFMRRWRAIGKKTTTPVDDISWNKENGAHPLALC
jgi:hypothetical protein